LAEIFKRPYGNIVVIGSRNEELLVAKGGRCRGKDFALVSFPSAQALVFLVDFA
jgi:hypothetical protein